MIAATALIIVLHIKNYLQNWLYTEQNLINQLRINICILFEAFKIIIKLGYNFFSKRLSDITKISLQTLQNLFYSYND